MTETENLSVAKERRTYSSRIQPRAIREASGSSGVFYLSNAHHSGFTTRG